MKYLLLILIPFNCLAVLSALEKSSKKPAKSLFHEARRHTKIHNFTFFQFDLNNYNNEIINECVGISVDVKLADAKIKDMKKSFMYGVGKELCELSVKKCKKCTALLINGVAQ